MSLTRAQMEKLLDKLEKPIRDAIFAAIDGARTRASRLAIERAIEAGDLQAVLQASGVREGMWSSVTESMRGAYYEAGATILASDVPKRFGMTFNINNPRAEEWLRKEAAAQITGNLEKEQIKAINEIMTNGMRAGHNPKTTALDIIGRIDGTGKRRGGVLGLTEQQAQYVVNARNDLDNFDRRYLRRKLRDKRYDAMVKKSIKNKKALPRKIRNKIIQGYENKLLRHRGENIARTEALRALNEASDEALRQVVQEGLAPRSAVVRIWKHSFGPNEREGHLRMNNQPRGIDEYFNNPITGAVLKHPGDGDAEETINCRCYLEHKINFGKVEKARRRAA